LFTEEKIYLACRYSKNPHVKNYIKATATYISKLLNRPENATMINKLKILPRRIKQHGS
jgi:hypothetical protein